MGHLKFNIPFTEVESWLFALPDWKSRLEVLEAQLEHIPGLAQKFELVAIHGQGQKNEAILQEVIRRLHAQEIEIPLLEMKIRMLEAAIKSLLPVEKRFVESKYQLRLPNPDVMKKLLMTSRIFFQHRKISLTKIYRFVGGPNSILGVPDDLSWLEIEGNEQVTVR
ncbi:hypothetical protein [Cohnella sp.]|uniref:hypothetical protein n=1 Tax=Cohnella sp. TaxID=1883426 RepID=UPI00356AD59E